jgi:hypothetical protein
MFLLLLLLILCSVATKVMLIKWDGTGVGVLLLRASTGS